MTYSVYYLVGGDNDIFYIGLTSWEFKYRLSVHKSYSKNRLDNEEKAEKILKYWDNLEICEIESLECEREEAAAIESYWIAQFHEWGFRLTNKTSIPKYKERKKSKPKKGILISENLYWEVRNYTEKNGMFLSGVIERAIIDYLSKNKKLKIA